MKHKIIRTENYLLVVDDSEIKVGDYFYDNDEELCIYTSNYIVTPNKWDDNKKIIAHLPLNNSPILDGVGLLPTLEDEVEKLADKIYPETYYNAIYVDGWLKARFIQSIQQPKMPINFEYKTKIGIQWVGKYIYE
jgi:hypothetical protein